MTPYASVALSGEQVYEGSHSVKLTHPTNLDAWPHPAKGRIYAEPGAMYTVDHEDWSGWNRLSVWVYPVADGMKSITIRLQLYNEGKRKVEKTYQAKPPASCLHAFKSKGRVWKHRPSKPNALWAEAAARRASPVV